MPVVVLEQKEEANNQGSEEAKNRKTAMRWAQKKKDSAESLRALRHAEKAGRTKRRARRLALTTPDLVLLSLLAERPMHGYQANLELERREIRDWAGISRPQVYYSLDKLARAGLIRAAESAEPAAGPDRSVFETTAKGRQALAQALEREEWTTQRERPSFLTWIALSWQARPGMFRRQIRRRQRFLEKELLREEATLRSILKEVGHPYHEAVWMVSLMIEQFKVELKWLGKLARELPRRAPARNPEYAKVEAE
jgi:DNA-binding PadR family transcriptional regulator